MGRVQPHRRRRLTISDVARGVVTGWHDRRRAGAQWAKECGQIALAGRWSGCGGPNRAVVPDFASASVRLVAVLHSSAQRHDMCTPCTNPGWHKPSQSAVPLPPPDHRPAAQRFWLESVEPAAHQAPGSHTPLQLDVGRAEVAPYLVHDMEVRTWHKRPTRPCHSHAATHRPGGHSPEHSSVARPVVLPYLPAGHCDSKPPQQ